MKPEYFKISNDYGTLYIKRHKGITYIRSKDHSGWRVSDMSVHTEFYIHERISEQELFLELL